MSTQSLIARAVLLSRRELRRYPGFRPLAIAADGSVYFVNYDIGDGGPAAGQVVIRFVPSDSSD